MVERAAGISGEGEQVGDGNSGRGSEKSVRVGGRRMVEVEYIG